MYLLLTPTPPRCIATCCRQTKEVVDLSSEIKQLRAEERRMRKEIKEGKERLKVLLSEKRDKKNDKARVMGILTLLDFWTVFLGVTQSVR